MVEIRKPNPALKFSSSLTPLRRAEKIVLHHMAHKTAGIHDVHNWHLKRTYITSSGKTAYWSGIGYNYWIAFDGTIYEGRGLNIGAHTLNWNDKTIGIGFQGHFEEQQMPDVQLQAGAALCKKLLAEYSLTEKDIVGHRELAATLCPGKNFRMKELKELLLSLESVGLDGYYLYRVQVGAFRYRENAERMRDRLREQGYQDAFIQRY